MLDGNSVGYVDDYLVDVHGGKSSIVASGFFMKLALCTVLTVVLSHHQAVEKEEYPDFATLQESQ